MRGKQGGAEEERQEPPWHPNINNEFEEEEVEDANFDGIQARRKSATKVAEKKCLDGESKAERSMSCRFVAVA